MDMPGPNVFPRWILIVYLCQHVHLLLQSREAERWSPLSVPLLIHRPSLGTKFHPPTLEVCIRYSSLSCSVNSQQVHCTDVGIIT